MKMLFLTMLSINNGMVFHRIVYASDDDDLKGAIECLAMKLEINHGIPFMCVDVKEIIERRNG